MDPVSIVAAALLAGASAGVKDTASAAVKDTYASLRDLVQRRLADKPAHQTALSSYEARPDEWQAQLIDALKEARVDEEPSILEAAEHLLASIPPDRWNAQHYLIDLREAKGVQLGNGNTQQNTFS